MSIDGRTALVYAVDDNYALPTAVSGRSAQDNMADPSLVSWYVLDLGLSDQSKNLIRRSWPRVERVEFPVVEPHLLQGLPATEAFPSKVFGRFFASQLLRDRHERLIYLDADTLVIQDLTPLTEVDLGTWAFGAVRDWTFLDSPVQEAGRRYSPGTQCNGGLLVMDTDRWCRQELTERIFRFARGHDDLTLPDQDAVNGVTQGRWQELGYEWNFQAARTVVRDYRGPLPRILHFSGARKPWLGRCALPHYLRLYRAYQRLTAYDAGGLEETGYPSYREDDGLAVTPAHVAQSDDVPDGTGDATVTN